MNKKGLIGKILLILLILVIIIVAIVAITVYQAYTIAKTSMSEIASINEAQQNLMANKNCSKIVEIEASRDRLENSAKNACRNPFLKLAIDKIKQLPYKCDNIAEMRASAETQMQLIKIYCNMTA